MNSTFSWSEKFSSFYYHLTILRYLFPPFSKLKNMLYFYYGEQNS